MLTEPQQRKLVEVASLIHYVDGQLIHCRGDDKPGLSIVKSGAVNVGISGSDGTFVLTTILGPGECFGEFTLFTELPRTHDIFASGESHIYQIPANAFLRVFNSDTRYAMALLKTNLLRNHQMLELFDSFQRLPLLARTAKMLLSMAHSSGQEHGIRCRQSDLAVTLGTTRVSLGKALKTLEKEGVISLGYGKITFPSTTALEDWVRQRCDTTPL